MNLVLSRLANVRKNGRGYKALCPAHNDTDPSLHVTEGRDGRTLLWCGAKCKVEKIVEAMGLTMSELGPKGPHKESRKDSRIVAAYDYRDEAGGLLFQAVRYIPKDFKQRRPDPERRDEWKYDLKGVRRVLYRLPETLDAIRRNETIYIVEGEKDADTLAGIGLPATCNSGGAGKWRTEYSETLRGANVAIIPDADPAGRDHAKKVAAALAGIAGTVKIMELPGPGKDAADWITAGGSREELERLVDVATLPAPNIAAEDTGTRIAEAFRPTDLWNARLFVHLHGDKVRYCDRMGGWFHYDGKRWTRAVCGEVERLAKDTVRRIYEIAALEPEDKQRQEMAKHATRSEAVGKITAMLDLARTEEGIIVSPDAFDADPWKFNVQNGTIVIHPVRAIVELKPHDPKDMITNISPAEWRDIEAPAPIFEKYLHESAGGDKEMMSFRRRLAGYALTGDMREQVFEYAYGPEAGGKGTETRARTDVMGTYARAAEMTTFLASRTDRVRNDLATLVGGRLVTASEPQEGQVFDEGLIRMLTGQDRMSARFLFKENFEFSCGFKIRFEGNHRPHIRSTGGATWRRLLVIPFEKTVPEDQRDKTLGEKLKSPEERAGILAWMVTGALEWLISGLNPPDKVRAAVADYRSAEDRLGPFLEDRCETGEGKQTTAGAIYAAYKAWCESAGERPMSQRSLGLRLEEKGFQKVRTYSTGRAWRGLALLGHDAS